MASKLKAKDPQLVTQGKAKGMMFGPSGAGKTWFSLTFPCPYYIDTEGGADLKHYQQRLKDAGGQYMGVDEGSLDFSTVIEQMQALATEQHGFKTLIIDSVTKLFQTAISSESERIIAGGHKDEFGASKKPAVRMMRSIVNWTSKLDMNVWFVAHEASEWGLIGGQRQEIGKCADVWDKLIYELDLTLQVVKQGPSRYGIVKKSRLLGFPDGDRFDLDYAEFAKRYGKDFIEAETKTITLASPESVAEIKRLVALLSISEEDVDKVLKKGAADKIEELSEEHAKKTITWLQAKIAGKEGK